MKLAREQRRVIPLLRSVLNTLISNKIILLPFCFIAFVQLLLLQIVYFSPRFPLNIIFDPLVKHYWSEKYLHFPYNFITLPRIFQSSYLQAFIYIVISSFMIGCSIAIIKTINNGHKVNLSKIFRETLGKYFRIAMVAAFTLLIIKLLFLITGKLSVRAVEIRSASGMYYLIKRAVLFGAPYLNLVFSALVTTIFAYVLPIIVIEEGKIFYALKQNFLILKKSFLFTFMIVLFPVLFLVPIILLRNSFSPNHFFPELTVLILAFSMLVMIAIDAMVYASITIYYLLMKEK